MILDWLLTHVDCVIEKLRLTSIQSLMQRRSTNPEVTESQKLIPSRGSLNHMWIQITLNSIASLAAKAANLNSISVSCQREKGHIWKLTIKKDSWLPLNHKTVVCCFISYKKSSNEELLGHQIMFIFYTYCYFMVRSLTGLWTFLIVNDECGQPKL